MRLGLGIGINTLQRRGTLASGPSASGGIETVITQDDKFYRVHTFLSSGDLTVAGGELDVEFLVIAGGGSGGNNRFNHGGGGGAGGWQKFVAGEAGNTASGPLELSPGEYQAAVGAGGVGVITNASGNKGQDSVFASVTAIGGGFGSRTTGEGGDGGSGGGGANANSPGGVGSQGNDGGAGTNSASGGGGGAGTAGQDAPIDAGGNGGDGLSSAIDGTATVRAGGGGGTGSPGLGLGGAGGGGDAANNADGGSGQPNTGSGGGGARGGASNLSGAGATGIVIVRYKITETEYNAESA